MNNFKKEFRLSKLKLNGEDERKFSNSQWAIAPVLYLIYRWLMTGYFATWFILAVVTVPQDSHIAHLMGQPGLFAAMLTTQTTFFFNLHLLISSILATSDFLKNFANSKGVIPVRYVVKHESENSVVISCPCKMAWASYNIAASMSLVVTAGYWGVVYPQLQLETLEAWDFNLHAANSIYFITDLFISAIPVRVLHCWMPMLFGMCYYIFALVYWLAGGTGPGGKPYIYKILDFQNDPGIAVLCGVFGLIALFIFHFIIYMLYRLRVALYERVGCGLGRKASLLQGDVQINTQTSDNSSKPEQINMANTVEDC